MNVFGAEHVEILRRKNAGGVMGEENSGRIASEFSAGRTPVALWQRRILAGLRPNSPQKNASGVMREENFGRITSGFSAKERRWRYGRGEFWQDYV